MRCTLVWLLGLVDGAAESWEGLVSLWTLDDRSLAGAVGRAARVG